MRTVPLDLELAIITWYQQYQAMGTIKSKARELNLNANTLQTVINRYRRNAYYPERRK